MTLMVLHGFLNSTMQLLVLIDIEIYQLFVFNRLFYKKKGVKKIRFRQYHEATIIDN